ncbi:hypothetical protein F5Y19DRAFT_437595 [Xylariaceae sp. FL1651]|nr:hypothetical protein F5Y19DRAFT_437595 [Xylariaceae sp. FL1651]
MMWTTAILSLSVAASHVWAAPVDGGLDLFKLKISSPANAELDGRYLALNGSSLGLYEGDDTSPVRVYQKSSEKKGCMELHTYPVGFVDHALGLVGPPGLMTFTDIVNPNGTKPGNGQVKEWDTFQMMSDNKLTNDGRGAWLAFPAARSSWKVKWSDGSAIMTTDYMPIEIKMEAAGQGRYNEE